MILTTLDFVIFFGSLLGIMAIGLWAGRKEDTSEDFYLAGKNTKWWGVAGSIFGSNVSANHVMGMMGVGFAFGFAQSHFEITAICGLLMLCYAFLPMYRKLKVYTLSEYLARRYGEGPRIAYACIMIAIMVWVMMVPGFYIGSRSINILMTGDLQVDRTWFQVGVVVMALFTGTYTIFGGLKAVIITDVIQSVLVLIAGIGVALIVFPKIGGWGAMVAMDAAANGGAEKLHLYNSSSHPSLPWSGVLSGLMVLHFYYWGANQFIVQRALSAGTDREARIGIISAGFFKLLIPFFSIGTGIAAYYIYRKQGVEGDIAQDIVFIRLLKDMVAPVGLGMVGIIAAGVFGAILSSLDSMMNSAATIFTFDLYKRFINPNASEKTLIRVGRIAIVLFILLAVGLCLTSQDPNSKDSFFLTIASHQGKLIAGVVVAFILGMLWRRASELGAMVSIVAGVALSYTIQPVYKATLGKTAWWAEHFGAELNFFHAVFIAALICLVLHIVISLLTPVDEEKAKNTWIGAGVLSGATLRRFWIGLAASLAVYAALAIFMVTSGKPTDPSKAPVICAWIAAIWTFGIFALAARGAAKRDGIPIFKDDKLWAGLLAACAIYMMYYYY